MIKKILAIAQDEIGYLEKRTNAYLDDKTANAGRANYTKYGKWYDEYYITAGFTATYWCHMFISWCAFKAGVTPDIIPYTASCPTGYNWFKQRGLWQNRNGYTPKPGDIIYFSYDGVGTDHIGIVTKSDSSRVYTIEGNTSGGSTLIDNGGGVFEKSYVLNYSCIKGYGTPNYKILEDDEVTLDYEGFKTYWNQLRTELRDNDNSAWSEDARNWAISNGLITGGGTLPSGEANFMWEDLLTREQAVQLFFRFAQLMGKA